MTRFNYSRNERNRLSDCDIFLDMLTTEKHMSHLYDHAVLESSGDLVRDTFQTLQQNSQSNAQKLFEVMQQRGWYNVTENDSPTNNKLQPRKRSYHKSDAATGRRETYINPGLNGTHRGKSGIFANAPHYLEQYNTPQ